MWRARFESFGRMERGVKLCKIVTEIWIKGTSWMQRFAHLLFTFAQEAQTEGSWAPAACGNTLVLMGSVKGRVCRIWIICLRDIIIDRSMYACKLLRMSSNITLWLDAGGVIWLVESIPQIFPLPGANQSVHRNSWHAKGIAQGDTAVGIDRRILWKKGWMKIYWMDLLYPFSTVNIVEFCI